VHDRRRELVIALGCLARGKLDALLAAPTAPARERVQPAEHGLGGAQVLCDVQASARGRAGRPLRADRGCNDQHHYKEHQDDEAATSDRQEDRKMAAKSASAKSTTAAEPPTPAAKAGTAAAAAR
jgi:hypothetical protein